MGLTERKVMFLTYQKELTFITGGTQENPGIHDHSMYLVPSLASNYKSIVGEWTFVQDQNTNYPCRLPNWDKMCVLGIYIKIQPVANTFDGSAASKQIYPVKCFYAMDSCPRVQLSEYDQELYPYKQVFTFNSNEAFTIYLPAPTTMDDTTAVVHRTKTWWSLAGVKVPAEADVITGVEENEADYDNDSMDEDQINDFEGSIRKSEGSWFHCGRLAFKCDGDAKFNVTINYKVALKG